MDLWINKSINKWIYRNSVLSQEIRLVLPLIICALNENATDFNHLNNIPEKIPTYSVLLIRAGYAALGIVENGIITKHKVIKKYMVRKRQGKAQLTYLSLKGRSRGGSRLRLIKTQEFFQEIREKLFAWKEKIDRCNLLFYQCTPRLWSNLFCIKSKFPIYSKSDNRLQKIPITTYKPTYKELRRVNHVLSKGKINIKTKDNISSFETLITFLNSI